MVKRSTRITEAEALARHWIKPADLYVPVAVSSEKKRRTDHEGIAQTVLIVEFGKKHPEFSDVLIHIPNGGSRSNKFEGYRLKSQGVKKGVSDLFLPVARGGHFGLWIEFKADPPFDARVTDEQRWWIAKMRSNCYEARICLGVESAMAVLTAYLQLSATQVRFAAMAVPVELVRSIAS
jgi:VRR-NUC domain